MNSKDRFHEKRSRVYSDLIDGLRQGKVYSATEACPLLKRHGMSPNHTQAVRVLQEVASRTAPDAQTRLTIVRVGAGGKTILYNEIFGRDTDNFKRAVAGVGPSEARKRLPNK